MKSFSAYGLLVLLLVSLGFNGYFLYKERQETIVARVLDGDTFELPDGDRVRLLGIDAPENTRCGSNEAKEYLSNLILGKPVTITEEKRDTYGRRMGLVYRAETLVNIEMLREGHARPDYTPNSQTDLFKAAYKEATEEKRGIHSQLCKKTSPQPPNPACRIKGNIDKATWDHYYHLPSCRHYNQIVLDLDLGEGYFCSEKEAKEAGFHLAPDCLR